MMDLTDRAIDAPQRGQEGEPVLAAALAGAGAIHFAMAPSHLGESMAVGVGFLVAGWVQLLLAAVLLGRSPRWARWATVVVSIALISAWAVSRTASSGRSTAGTTTRTHASCSDPTASRRPSARTSPA